MTVGCDIEDPGRFAGILKDSRLLSNIFTEDEIVSSMRRSRPEVHLARKFACKEAVFKALSSAGCDVPLKLIEITGIAGGGFTVKIAKRGIGKAYRLSVGVSGRKDAVLATAIAEKLATRHDAR